jgi:sigma-B regulation protein RsbU (phosphoserine phosphatase)
VKLRTSVFLWVLLLVLSLLAASIGAVAAVVSREIRGQVREQVARSRDVTLDLHAYRQSLYGQECRVLAEEPRLKAVVATEDIEHETVFDAVQTLAGAIGAGVFVIVDAHGRLLADLADPQAVGFDLSQRPLVAGALSRGTAAAVWLGDGKAYQVQACRLHFGASVVGALVLGHVIDDAIAATVARQTGSLLLLAIDGRPAAGQVPGVPAPELQRLLQEIHRGAREVVTGDRIWQAVAMPVPSYRGERRVEYVLLRSLDMALAARRRLTGLLALLAGVAAAATLVLALGIARSVSRPIDALVERTGAIARGDLAPRAVSGPTEIRALGDAMNDMADEMARSRHAMADRERLAREMEIAERIQTSILPRQLAAPGLQIAARMLPADQVGGDYYDVLPVEDGCWIAVGDVSGHGVTAGLVMMMVQTGVSSLVTASPDALPSQILGQLNRVIFDNVHRRLTDALHVTLSLLRYHPDGRLVVAGAHMDAVLLRAGSDRCEFLRTEGTWIAITDDISSVTRDQEWRLSPGDLLVIPTDGIVEAESASGQSFGYAGLEAALLPLGNAPVELVCDRLFEVVLAHASEPADDASLVILRYVGGRGSAA